jgi:hypothetical protein
MANNSSPDSHGLFKHRNFALCLAGIFIEGVVYITMNVFTPSQVRRVLLSKRERLHI